MCNNCYPPDEVPDPAHGEAVGYTFVIYLVVVLLVLVGMYLTN